MTTAILNLEETQREITSLLDTLDGQEQRLAELVAEAGWPETDPKRKEKLNEIIGSINSEIISMRSKLAELREWQQRLTEQRHRQRQLQRQHQYQTEVLPKVAPMQERCVRDSQRLVEASQEMLLALLAWCRTKDEQSALKREIDRLNPRGEMGEKPYWPAYDLGLLPLSNDVHATSILNFLRRILNENELPNTEVLGYIAEIAGLTDEGRE